MSNAISEVDNAFAIAHSLSSAQKLELISRLWNDVRGRGEFRPSDSDLAEIKRRWAEYEAGKVKSIPWEEVRDEMRRRLDDLKANA